MGTTTSSVMRSTFSFTINLLWPREACTADNDAAVMSRRTCLHDAAGSVGARCVGPRSIGDAAESIDARVVAHEFAARLKRRRPGLRAERRAAVCRVRQHVARVCGLFFAIVAKYQQSCYRIERQP